ncbi:MAG: Rrf2 family transcriptional regulator [Deltaproteobacteria bacterium]|nr:Rrf2 family transcriptional regulator [Deltaproteobacteria bacterium]
MKLTKLEEQGLRLAMCLARHKGQLTLAEMAVREGMSEALVASVLHKLRHAGVVKAVRGRYGGYELEQDPESLTVAAVLTSFGRPLLFGCFNQPPTDGDPPCVHAGECGLRPVWEELEDQISRVLTAVTVADLLNREHNVRKQVTGLRPTIELAPDSDGRIVDRCGCGYVFEDEADVL